MRILLTINLPWTNVFAGAVKSNQGLTEALAARGHQVRVVVPAIHTPRPVSHEQIIADLEADGIEVFSDGEVDIFARNGVEAHAVVEPSKLRQYLIEEIKRFKPDWVMVSSEDPSQTLLEAALTALPTRVIYLAHTLNVFPFGKLSMYPGTARTELVGRAAGIVAISKYVADYIKEWSGFEAFVNHPPHYGSGPFPVFGRFNEGHVLFPHACVYKGISIFLKVAEALPHVRFAALPGYATTKADLDAMTRLSNVSILQNSWNVDDFLRRTSILLMPSLWPEGFGMVAVDAMLRAIPVLASNFGGLLEAKLGTDYLLPAHPIESFEGRLDENLWPIPIVPTQDATPWIEAVSDLISDRVLYERQSAASRKAALEFNASLSVAPLEEFLQQLAMNPEARLKNSTPKAREERPKARAQAANGNNDKFASLTSRQRDLLMARLREKAARGAGEGTQSPAITPAARGERIPLSFAQQRLWFLNQMDPASPIYHLPNALRMTGALDWKALERTLVEIVRRHESLRTSFSLVDGQPAQIISPASEMTLPVADLAELPEQQRIAEAARLVAMESERAFDLTRGPLLRIAMLRMSEDDHILIFVMHHIISDAWSAGVLVREVVALYAAFSAGNPSPLPEPSIQYADYACWQREWLSGEVLETQMAYWKQKLNGLPSVLELPTDRPRPAIKSFRGAGEPLLLPQQIADSLKEISRNEGATLFMTLLAAFNALLFRLSNQADILVGTPIAGRNRLETEGLIGFFVNTLVLRTQVSGDMSFRELLASVRETTIGAFTHQDLPFEKLVEQMQPERTLSHTPLFQVVFALQNVSRERLEMPGITLTSYGTGGGTAKFDLTLFMGEEDGALAGTFNYNTDLFDRRSIKLMVGYFRTMVEAIIADLDQPLCAISLLTEGERRALLDEYDSATTGRTVTECLHEIFERQAQRAPGAIAIVCENEKLDYHELNCRANQLAHYLKSLGVGPESLVAICIERSIEMVVAILGTLKAGGAYVPLDPMNPKQRLSYLMKDAGAEVLLSQQSLIDSLPDHSATLVLVDAQRDAIAAQSDENPRINLSADNAAYVIYTSGSTGAPKGVVVTHYNVGRLLEATDDWFHFNAKDVWTLFHSYAFDFSVWELWGCLLNGGHLIVVPYWVSRSPEAFYDLLVENQVTVLNQTPSAFRQLIQADKDAGDGNELALRAVIFGGEALELQSLRPWFERHGDAQPHLINMYGITETTVHVTYRLVTMSDVLQGAGSVIGQPIPDLQTYILDDRLQLTPELISGEMHVGGQGLARGYLNRPDLTAERFIPNPHSKEPGARLYKTGDLAKRMPGRDMQYLGRIDNQVKIRGFRIELGEIEAALGAHMAISESAVMLREDAEGQKRLVAYVVSGNDEQLGAEDLRNHLKAQLPDYMVPSSFVVLEALPLTANGKIDRAMLPAPDYSRSETEGAFVAARNEKEEILASIWSQVLGIEQVSIDDNYFSLGGDSIRSIQVRARAQERGLNLSLQDLFQHQSIRQLAQVINFGSGDPVVLSQPFSLISEEDRLRLPDDIEDAYPLAMLQAGMLFHSELDSDVAAFHDVFSYHLRAPLDINAMQTALQRLIDKQAVLRTSFDLNNFSQPLQLAHRRLDAVLQVGDISSLSFIEQNEAIRVEIEKEKNTKLDWERPPLLKFLVHRRTAEHFQFTLSFHHAILDGWSVATMLTELFQNYLSLIAGDQLSPEAPLSTTFRDFVALEQAALNSQETRQFWIDHLSESTMTELPHRPVLRAASEDSSQVKSVPVPVSSQTSEGLKSLARQISVPIKTVLLAAHLRVLAFLSGRSDVVTGVGFNGRPETIDGELVLGLFLNTLPFRLKLNGGTWADIAKAAFDLEQKILRYRRYPMSRIKEENGGKTLFQTAFNFIHFHVYHNLNNLSSGIEVLDRVAFERTDITLLANFTINLVSSEVGLTLSINPAELPDELTESIRGYYQRALEAMANSPFESYESACLLSDEERNKILVEWNRTETQYPQGLCFHDLIHLQALAHPHRVALKSAHHELTFHQLDTQANHLAGRLIRLGVGPDDRVAIFIERSVEMVICMLAVAKAGAAYLPVDLQYPVARISYMLEESGAKAVLTRQGLERRLPGSDAQVVRVDSLWEFLADESEQHSVRVDERNLAYVIYTSGSTGKPKGVMVEHKGLMNYLMYAVESYGVKEAEASVMHTSLGFDLTVTSVLVPLVAGKRVEIVGEEEGIAGLVEWLKKAEGKVMVKLTPAHLEVINEQMREAESGAAEKVMVVGGEALSRVSVERLKQKQGKWRVINEYGPTETVVGSSTYEVSEAQQGEGERKVAIGRPISNARMYVLDERMEVVGVGVKGEICIAGAGVSRGYMRRGDLTAERYVSDPYSEKAGERMYRTGDEGRYREDGEIEYIGRRDEQVKVRGYRVEVGEIEEVIKGIEGVREAVVMVREEQEGDKRIVGYVVVKKESEVRQEQLREMVGAQLPEYMIPSAFVLLEALPLTINGKIDRQALPAPGGSRVQSEKLYVAPRTALEQTVADVWERVLRLDRISIHDNFFEIGGHSLTAIQVFSRINKSHNARISLRDLFASPTIAQLAEAISNAKDSTYTEIEPLPQQPFYDLSHAQKRLWVVCQSEEASVAYNNANAYFIEGDLNLQALSFALTGITKRHESLRTTFVIINGEPKQKIHDDIGFQVEVIDLTGNQSGEEIAKELAHKETLLPFDLEAGPLMRARLIRLQETKYLFLLTIHHIVSDAWSMRVMVKDLLALYNSYRNGGGDAPGALKVHYKDYAAWENRQLAGASLEEHRQYWLTKLAGELPVIDLPTDYSRPPVQTFNGNAHHFIIKEELTEGLYALGKSDGASLFMCLLAAVYALLYRYTGQQDLIIASPITGRNHEDLEDQIGFFLNMLALRVEVRGEDSITGLLRKVKLTTLQAYQHQIYPFDWLVKDLNTRRDPSRSPLMDVTVSLQNQQPAGQGVMDPGFSITPAGQENKITKNDLWFGFTESNGYIGAAIHYNTDLFKAETIELMALRLEKLISHIVNDYEIAIMDITLSQEAHTDEHLPEVTVELNFDLQA